MALCTQGETMNNFIESVFPFFFGAIVIYMAYGFIRKKGFRGMMFGAEVINTVGEVKGKKRGAINTTIKVHTLKGNDNTNNHVGIELISKSFASYHMMPFSISASDAKKLANLLNEASGK